MAYIYKITNKINGKIYIGKTTETVEERFKQHCRDKNKSHLEKRPLYEAMNKYGVDNFIIEPIEEVSYEVLNEREQYWIEKYQSFKNGYNATRGGDGKLYLDYEYIFSVWQTNHNCVKTAVLCHCSKDSVAEIVKEFGEKAESTLAQRKAVAKIDIETGAIIETYPSVNEAERANGNSRHIAQVCNGKRKTCQGFKWEYI